MFLANARAGKIKSKLLLVGGKSAVPLSTTMEYASQGFPNDVNNTPP